jgi:hypothetical protein
LATTQKGARRSERLVDSVSDIGFNYADAKSTIDKN